MQTAPPTPKGFRDILPEIAKKRRAVINTISDVLQDNNFVPLETPIVEFASTLMGKYGEEERLIYKFTDRGGRELALRYDLTVPLARFIANNQSLLNPTFSRFQVGEVFRGENPQAGRYRQFTQFDFDTIGSSDLTDDAKIIVTALKAAKALKLEKPTMYINDRKIFQGYDNTLISAIDKLDKIGKDKVIEELVAKGQTKQNAQSLLNKIEEHPKTDTITEIFNHLEGMTGKDLNVIFKPTLARGLNYYTGAIFELVIPGYNLSIGGGGRYDNLIGMFTKRDIPAVGFSFGIDRIVELS